MGPVSAAFEAEFVSWCVERGVRCEGLRYPAVSSAGERGVRAASRLRPGDELVSVPTSLCLTLERALSDATLGPHLAVEPALRADADADGKIVTDYVLAAYLAHSRAHVDASALAPWLRILPDLDVLADWPDAELCALQDDALAESARVRRAAYADIGARVVGALRGRAPDVFGDDFTVDLFVWGLKTVGAFFEGARSRVRAVSPPSSPSPSQVSLALFSHSVDELLML